MEITLKNIILKVIFGRMLGSIPLEIDDHDRISNLIVSEV